MAAVDDSISAIVKTEMIVERINNILIVVENRSSKFAVPHMQRKFTKALAEDPVSVVILLRTIERKG